MIPQVLKSILLAQLLIFQCGCIKSLSLRIFNESTKPISAVTSLDPRCYNCRQSISPHQFGKIAYDRQLKVLTDEAEYSFFLLPVGESYIHTKKRYINLLWNGDGTLYLLPPKKNPELTAVPSQPPGWPLCAGEVH